MANSVPYLTEDQIRKNYAKAYSNYEAQRNAEAQRAEKKTNAQYDTAQRQNYVNYMQNKRQLPDMLAQQGLSGGASETATLRAQTNYENNYNNTERDRGNDIASIRGALSDALSTYRMTADQNMNDEIAQNRQLRSNYEKQLQQEAEQRFANTISGYDNVSTINNLIESIKKSGKDTWRIPYLRARRAELVAAQQAMAASGGSSGGGYSYSGGGGGGGADEPVYEEEQPKQMTREEAIAAVRKRFGIDGKPKSSGSALAGKAKSNRPRGLVSRLRSFM